MERVKHEIWAEQDEDRSRLMLKIGDDAPIELFSWNREWARRQAMSLTGTWTAGGREFTGQRSDQIGHVEKLKE